jgi:hypothetical protein
MILQTTDFELGDENGVNTSAETFEQERVCRLQCMIALLLEKNERLRMQLFGQIPEDTA